VVETESIHLQKHPALGSMPYDALFSIRKQDDESLTSVMTRVDQAMQQVKDLHPLTFQLDDLDGELASISLIQSTPR